MNSYSSVSLRRFQRTYPMLLILAILPKGCSVRRIEDEPGRYFVGVKADPFSEPTEVGKVKFQESILYVEFFDTEMGKGFKKEYYMKYPELEEIDKK